MLKRSTLRQFFLRYRTFIRLIKLTFDVVSFKQLNIIFSEFNHLSHIDHAELDDDHTRVHLDVDAFCFFAERDIKRGPVGSPFAIRNLLGWTITSPLSCKYLDKESRDQQTNIINARNREQPTLSKLVKKFWKVEKSAISVDFLPSSNSSKIDKLLKVMEDSIYHDGREYNMNLLLKQNVMLTNNFAIAKAQLGSLQERLKRTKTFWILTTDRYLLDSCNKSLRTLRNVMSNQLFL